MIHLHTTVEVRPDVDPNFASDGFALLHPYVEQVWLPILGPSSVLVLRNLGRRLGTAADPVTVDLAELAAEIGLGTGVGRNSALRRTLARLERFGHLRILNPAQVELGMLARPVDSGLLYTLPVEIRRAHDVMTATAVAR